MSRPRPNGSRDKRRGAHYERTTTPVRSFRMRISIASLLLPLLILARPAAAADIFAHEEQARPIYHALESLFPEARTGEEPGASVYLAPLRCVLLPGTLSCEGTTFEGRRVNWAGSDTRLWSLLSAIGVSPVDPPDGMILEVEFIACDFAELDAGGRSYACALTVK